jgi:predicted N-acetyltransferase YhbS
VGKFIIEMKFTTSLIKHSDISEEELSEICILKAVRWIYTLEQHKKWMTENIQPNDFHILVKEDKKPIAYANLVVVKVLINNEELYFRGIGNVCTSETGRGFGNILMEEINVVLEQNQWKGILLCKDHLIPYYEKFNWRLIDKYLVKAEKFSEINFMIYNFEDSITLLKYNDRNF